MKEETAIVRRTILSACRQYRYTLWREWTIQADLLNPPTTRSGRWPDRSYAMFIGLNPSTADETKDDPTIRKCIGFSKQWGFSGLMMTNLFAFRATMPEDMKRAENPSGEDNQHHLLQCASGAGIIVAAWGKHGDYRNQDLTVMEWIGSIGTRLHCLRTNGDGSPEHPLYVPYAVTPKPYENRKRPLATNGNTDTTGLLLTRKYRFKSCRGHFSLFTQNPSKQHEIKRFGRI